MATLTITNGELDMEVQQGKTWRIHVTLTDGRGDPVTATDCRWQVRKTFSSTEPILSLTTLNGVTIGTGTLDLVVDASVTEDIGSGTYVHEIELHTSSTEVPPFLSGKFVVFPEVVR